MYNTVLMPLQNEKFTTKIYSEKKRKIIFTNNNCNIVYSIDRLYSLLSTI